MATTTRAAVRRRAVSLARAEGRSRGFASRDGGTTALLATSGSTGGLTDTGNLPPTGAATTWSKDHWLWLPSVAAAADRKRIISSYAAATQTLTHAGPAYAAATETELDAATEPYLITRDDPDLWDSAINEALRTLLSTIEYDEWTPTTSGLVRYVVSAAPISLTTGMVRSSQILELDTHGTGDPSGQERWVPWANGYRTWRAYMDQDDVILDFETPDRAPGTSDRMRIKWASQYTVLTDETTTRDLDEYWAALATCVVMADWLANPTNPADDWNIIGRRVREQFAAQRRLILGSDAYRQVGRTAQQSGIAGVRGRMGR